MGRYEELAEVLKDVKEPKKSFVLSLLHDFVWLDEQINALREYPRYIINPNNPREQIKLEAHNMIKDFQAQKNDIATKILRCIDTETTEESPLMRALAQFNDRHN